MRLLNVFTYRLESYPDAFEAPPYAILSQTWGTAEILFADVNTKEGEYQEWKSREGAGKILMSATQARKDGLRYIWIDNICIDKSSSAELSEAINSMFNWYKTSEVCYAYLGDVRNIADLGNCRWFSRGWTLQELVAPSFVEFYDEQWFHIGSRSSLADRLEGLTKIDRDLLLQDWDSFEVEQELASISIATKMTGCNSRFSDTTDFSILAYETESNSPSSLLAPHPRCFKPGLCAINQESLPPTRSSSQSVTFECFLCPIGGATETQFFGAVLDCYFGQDVFSRAVLILECVDSSNNIFVRTNYQRVYHIEEHGRLAPYDIFVPGTLNIEKAQRRVFTIHLRMATRKPPNIFPPLRFYLTQEPRLPFSYEFKNSIPYMLDDIISHPVSQISVDGYAAGYIVLARSSDTLPPENRPLSVTWGMWNATEPWCRVRPFQGDELEAEWLSKVLGPGDNHELGDIPPNRFIPKEPRRSSYDPREGFTDVLLAHRKSATLHSGGYPAHTITARIRLKTLWGQSRLELELAVNMLDPETP